MKNEISYVVDKSIKNSFSHQEITCSNDGYAHGNVGRRGMPLLMQRSTPNTSRASASPAMTAAIASTSTIVVAATAIRIK